MSRRTARQRLLPHQLRAGPRAGRDAGSKRTGLGVLILALLAFPFMASAFQLDLACQVFLACVGALSLMLLTGYAGQISLGHAGLMAAGAFTVGILFRETNAPFWITLPAAALVGALLGDHLRLAVAAPARALSRGQHAGAALRGDLSRRRIRDRRRGFSTGIVIDPPTLGGVAITDGRVWYFILLAAAAATLLLCVNLLRSAQRAGLARDPRARDRRRSARHQHCRLQAPGLRHQFGDHGGGGRAVRLLPRLRLGRGVLAVPHPSSIVAMVIIGGMGSLLGALLGATFVTLFPYIIEVGLLALPDAQRYAGLLFAVNYAGVRRS